MIRVALIVLASANGSPGVTTAALGLAMAWPRPTVLIDADPTGARAIPAGWFRGGRLPGAGGTILDLAAAHRRGALAEELPRLLTPVPDTHIALLNGTARPSQARGLGDLWAPLAATCKGLQRTGQDVIVDAGRLGLDGSPVPLLAAADLALLVTRSTIPALVAAAAWAPALLEIFPAADVDGSLGALVVGPGRPFTAAEVARTLQIPAVASLAWDPPSAQVFSDGAPQRGRKFQTAPLSKSLRAAAAAVRTVLARSQSAADPARDGSYA